MLLISSWEICESSMLALIMQLMFSVLNCSYFSIEKEGNKEASFIDNPMCIGQKLFGMVTSIWGAHGQKRKRN